MFREEQAAHWCAILSYNAGIVKKHEGLPVIGVTKAPVGQTRNSLLKEIKQELCCVFE